MSLILRGTKGAALTHAELDNNQVWLKSRDIVSASVDVNNNLILTKDDFSYYSVPLSGIGTTISGLTFSGNVLTITQSDGSSVSVNISSVDIRVTDLIYSGSTLYLNQSDGSQESVFIPQFTGGTVNGYTIFSNGLSANTFTTNSLTLNGVTITGFTDYVFTGNTSGDCITDLFVSNVNSCSPLHIQPLNTGDVYIGENGGVNVGIGTSSPTRVLDSRGTFNLQPSTNTFLRFDGTIMEAQVGSSNNQLTLNRDNQGITDLKGSGSVSILNTTYSNSLSIGTNTILRENDKIVFSRSDNAVVGWWDTLNYRFRVGTGMLSPVYSSTTETFEVVGTSKVTGNVGIGITGSTDSTSRLQIKGSDSSSSNYGLKVQNSGGTDNFVVRNDGNVGINTSNPNYQLEVLPKDLTGTTNVVIRNTSTSPNWAPVGLSVINGSNHGVGMSTSSNGVDTQLNINSGMYSQLTHSVNGTPVAELGTAGDYLLWRLPNTFDFRKRSNNYTWLRFDSLNQNLSIFNETGSPPSINSKLGVRGSDSSSSNYGLKVQNSGGTDNLVVRNDGNVGIGTSIPNAKLHINNITTGNTVLFEDDTSPDPSPFVIDNGGKVGVGTTTPSEKLEVNNGFIKTNQGVIVDGGTFYGLRFNGSGNSRFAIDNSYKLNAAFTEGFKFTNGVYDFFNYDQSGFGDTFQIGNGLIKGRTTGTTDVYLGINVLGTPSSTLEVNGKTKTTNLQVTSGSPQVGYVLTATDTDGNMTWQVPTGGGTFTGGTVSGSTNFTGGLTANTLTVGTFQVGRKYSSSESFTGSVIKTITHNLNTQDVIVQLWDSSNNLLNGATITANNVNSVDITVASTTTYKVVIIG
jgi:hypothetical protein